jgi:hypothetical protein
MVSKMRPKFMSGLLMPCWNIEFRRVLEIMRSAHCTITMHTKYEDCAWWSASFCIIRDATLMVIDSGSAALYVMYGLC